MATVTKFQDFADQLIRGIHDFDAHSFKICLTNTAPVATNSEAIHSELNWSAFNATSVLIENFKLGNRGSNKLIQEQERYASTEHIRTTQEQQLRTSNSSAIRQSNKQTISR